MFNRLARGEFRSVLATHRQLRLEIHSHRRLAAALLEARDLGAHLYPSVGNVGDGLISLGTFDLLRALGTRFPLALGLDQKSVREARYLVLGGGGGWVEGVYSFWPWLLRPFLDRGGRLLVLPSSFLGCESFFAEYSDQVELFCREQESFDRLSSLDSLAGRVHLCHDLALAVNPRRFAAYRLRGGFETINVFRTDVEGIQDAAPAGNVDLPLIVNGIQWADESQCAAIISAVAHLLSRFSTVETDRLHMTALSAMIGRRTIMKANSYFKNAGVYQHTLSRFSNVTFSK